jgi:hypothetical protein
MIHFGKGSLAVSVRISEKTAKGTVVLPRHRLLAWQRIEDRPVLIPINSIERLL